MRVVVHVEHDRSETEVHVYCQTADRHIERLVSRIHDTTLEVVGDGERGKASVSVEDIFYFDTIDKKTFMYLEKEVLECRRRLFELEEYLSDSSVIRISKNCLLNTEKVFSVFPYYGGRLQVELENGERLIVSKKYTRQFKNSFLDQGE